MNKKIIVFETILFLIACFFVTFSPEACAEEFKVLIYMFPCDLEKESAAVTEDLKEIVYTTASHNGLEIYVCLGGAEELWFPNLQGGHGYDLRIQNGKVEILHDYEHTPCAEEGRLLRFLEDYGENGADLIFWGHGYPGMKGVGCDVLFEDDTLTLQEISSSLDKSGLTFRLIGFDACSMATLEAAWTTAPFARWFAAPSKKESLRGWNYREVLHCLSDSDSTELSEYLRTRSLQTESRMREESRLTVLKTDALLRQEQNICQVLDSTASPTGIQTLSEAAHICQDKEAAVSVLDMLDMQTLLLTTGEEPLTETTFSGLLWESYVSFLNRK